MDAVKSFLKGYTTSKTKKRRQLIEDLSLALSTSITELPAPALKLVISSLVTTLFRYGDRGSKLAVSTILQKLCSSSQGNTCVSALNDAIKDCSKCFENPSISCSQAKSALTALQWTTIVTGHMTKVDINILRSQATLLAAISDSPHTKKTWKLAVSLLQKLWRSKKGLAKESLSVVLASEVHLSSLVLLGCLAEFLSAKDSEHQLEKSEQDAILNYFVKTVLSSRAKPLSSTIVSCGGIFKKVSHSQFSSILLQPTLKCLLRNPDELLEAVGFMVSAVPIDVSQYAEDISKNAVSHLSSHSPATREHAQMLFKALAKQSSDLRPVEQLSKQLFTALKSSPSGKLTVADHRCSVLSAIESLSLCPLSSSSQQQLASSVSEGLVVHIKQEVHTGTAVLAINVLKTWCPFLANSPPKTVLDALKAALSSKSTAPQLLVAYLHTIPALCSTQGEGNSLAELFKPLVATVIERVSASSPSPQPALLEGALVASYVLIKISYPGAPPQQVWSLIDSYSEQLVSSKVISAAAQDGSLLNLSVLVGVAEVVLCSEDHTPKESQQRQWLEGVVQVMLNSPWKTQKAAAQCLSRAVEHQPKTALMSLDILEAVQEKAVEFPPNPFLNALLSLATPTNPEREEVAICSLIISFNSEIATVCPSAWLSILKKLDLSPSTFISQRADNLISLIESNISTRRQSCLAAMATLLRYGADDLLPNMVKRVCSLLSSPEVGGATSEQLEIMCTPEGQLWHRGMTKELDSALTGGLETANLKRESKAYSYEDQKWEVELRKEMMKKRKEQVSGRGKDVRTLIKEAKLSQKQKQAIEDQLSYEEATRKTLSDLNEKLSNMVAIFKVAQGEMLIQHIPALSKAVLGSLSSPLATVHCWQLWSILCHSIFTEWSLGQLFCETSLLALSSPSSLPRLSALPRLLSLLEKHSSSSSAVDSAAHSLTLPLLRTIIMSHDGSRDLKDSAVCVLCKAVREFTSSYDETQPLLFPVADVLRLLSMVMAYGEGTIKEIKMKKPCFDAFISLASLVHDHVIPILTSNLLDPSPQLRLMALKALLQINPTHLTSSPELLVAMLVARYDREDDNKTLAEKLWESSGFGNSLTDDLVPLLIQHVSSSNLVMHDAVAKAMGVWLEVHRNKASNILDQLIATYNEKKTAPPPTSDEFGRVVVIEYHDIWECRVGVAKAMEQVQSFVDASSTMKFLKFVIPGALSDPRQEVREAIMTAARAAITTHGEELSGKLMTHFEECLNSAPDTHEADAIRQSAVVLMGTLAKHMDKKNPKVKEVIHLLLSHLDTPSQTVQEAIANCLPPLASVIKPDAEQFIKKLLDKLLDSTSYSARKGAAYGLAGLVKGLGIPTLKQYQVMQTLQEAIKDKKNYKHREGALFAFESLCNMLGRLFEPYVVHLLPDLLLCFGDGNQFVREATDQTARTIMAHLSSHGVKLILPSLLSALEEDSWRTKAGSAELLGAMAYCAPKQLSSCLPSIVPRLMDVLADSHSKVQMSGSQALKQIGSVIKNPEIQVLVPVLLEALADPSNKAQGCLQALLNTEFVHVIDPPSLALIMPTLKRTLEIRSTDTKKMAAQIIGNMYSLTDRKDLSPYLPDVLPGLKQSLVDPVPEVRSVCAKALGAMVKGMGEQSLQELLPWLLQTLTSESSSVDRSGAAQGLSEVLCAQGVSHLSQLMPQFVSSCQDTEQPTHIRDGYLMLFVYLPITFGEEFTPFVADTLPCVLKGLADESEFIRDTSLQAGQTIVNRYADTAVELFLPQLEQGLFDENWRIRCSSIQLLGDLLYKISGLSGKMSTESEEDDNFGTEDARAAILACLGHERRNRVLAGLYMGRSDVALMVRQASLHIWKIVVTNTAHTLREILPTLIHLLLGCLASDSHDKRKVAARTLGDLVRKLGERVLPEVIPMLEKGLGSKVKQERQGVCIGLSEIIEQTSRDNVLLYVDSLLPTVCNALRDEEPEVRAAAAMTFNSLHSNVGPRILDEVLTPLLNDLSSAEKSEVALDGLKQVMAVKSKVVLPHLIPQLVKPPANTKALALLSSVAGDALHKHLDRIIPALIHSLKKNTISEVTEHAEGVVLSVKTEPGPAILIEELVKASRSMKEEERVATMTLVLALCSRSTAELNEHLPQLLIFTAEALNDPSDGVCEKAWLALEATVKRLNQKELPHYTGYLHKALKTVSSNLLGEELHGFALKGITPAMVILKEGLLNGSPTEKEEAARVLVEVIHLSSQKTLSSGRTVMLIAGPLIRVLGDRFSWSVRVATLEALVELVRKVGAAAKSFIPQLQTSYLKALNDANRPVRVMAVVGLTELLPLSPRVDPVINDLHNGIKKTEDPSLRLTLLQAMSGVIKVAGQKMSEKHRNEVLATLLALQTTAQEGHRLEAARCEGQLCAYLSDTELRSHLSKSLLTMEGVTDWSLLQAKATALATALSVAADRISELGLREEACRCVVSLATSDRVPVCEAGLKCLESFVNHMTGGDVSPMYSPLCQSLTHSSTDIRVVGCDVCASLESLPDPLLSSILPLLLQNTKEKNTAVRSSAEKAITVVVQGDAHLKHCLELLDSTHSRWLEEAYVRFRNKHSKDL